MTNKFLKYLFLFLGLLMPRGGEARSLYVSSSEGLQTNDGLNPLDPVSDLNQAIQNADTIYLKAGDVFYEWINIDKKYISRYGKGENPQLCGYKRLKIPQWKNIGVNLWQISLCDSIYTGMTFSSSSTSNNICCLHEYDKDVVHGRKVRYQNELASDWDFWQTDKIKDAVASDYDNLVLYFTGNPNNLKLEFSIYNTAVVMRNTTLDGVDIIGFGFGISAGTNSLIKNCMVDAIGGRLIQEGNGYICYGNGIEFYVASNITDCLVENCVVSRCYDAGLTIQASERGQSTPSNILIRNNMIEGCCQAWEDFLRNDDDVMFQNCVFENNVVLNSGNSGFGYPVSRFKYCHVLGNNYKGNRGMIIRNNIFIGGNFYCSGDFNNEYKSNKWLGNICYIERGDFLLGSYSGQKDVIRVPKSRTGFRTLGQATEKAIEHYRQLTGDYTTKFIIFDRYRIKRMILAVQKKYKNKQ